MEFSPQVDLPKVVASSSTSGPILKVQGLTKNFSTVEKALDNVSFEALPGQALALIGSDSAGKSTVLRCCAGNLRPDSGTIVLFGFDIWSLTPKRLKEIQRQLTIFEDIPEKQTTLTALQFVLSAARAHTSKFELWLKSSLLRSARAEALEYLAAVGCAHLAKKKIRELSIAEQRYICIAAALMQRAQLILADNPTEKLDQASAERFMDLFVTLMRKERRTLLFSTRELVDALAYADRAVALHQGRIELDAPVGLDCVNG